MKTLFFDLFWTLLCPTLEDEDEYKLLSVSEWDYIRCSEDERVSTPRYLGEVTDELQMIRDIASLVDSEEPISEEICERVLQIRLSRIRKGTVSVRKEVLDTLHALKEKGYRMCLVSNADKMDIHYWDEGPLRDIFDAVVFSCEVHVLKPDPEIYKLAMEKMGVQSDDAVFIGDGGSHEIEGAKRIGMTTILTEHFSVKSSDRREEILKHTNHCIKKFEDLLGIL